MTSNISDVDKGMKNKCKLQETKVTRQDEGGRRQEKGHQVRTDDRR